MPEDMVTVPADALHAVLGVFARIEQLAKSPRYGNCGRQ